MTYVVERLTIEQVAEHQALIRRAKKLERLEKALSEALREASDERIETNRKIALFRGNVMKEIEGQ